MSKNKAKKTDRTKVNSNNKEMDQSDSCDHKGSHQITQKDLDMEEPE